MSSLQEDSLNKTTQHRDVGPLTQEIERLRQENELYRQVYLNLHALISDSTGVAGQLPNGEVTPWNELMDNLVVDLEVVSAQKEMPWYEIVPEGEKDVPQENAGLLFDRFKKTLMSYG